MNAKSNKILETMISDILNDIVLLFFKKLVLS